MKCQNPACAWTGPESETRHPSTCTYTRFCPVCGEVCAKNEDAVALGKLNGKRQLRAAKARHAKLANPLHPKRSV